MLEACALTDTGSIRPTNQDSFRIVPKLGLYLLADGMGGARGGERASRLTVETVAEVLGNLPHPDEAGLLASVEEANRRDFTEAKHDPLLEGMGTTLVAALETGENDVAIASVGDSRAWLLDGGKLRAITEDQTWVREVGRPLGIDETSLRIHPMRHVLTMAVGVGETVRIHHYAVPLQPGAIMMLSSDGLHGVVTEEEIERILNTRHAKLQEKCHALIAATLAAGSPDNVTVVLMRRFEAGSG